MSDISPRFSFEFTPLREDAADSFAEAVQWYATLNPEFFDVTYGAGGKGDTGSEAMLKTTLRTITAIRKNAPGVPVILHMPSVRFSRVSALVAFSLFWVGEYINDYMPMRGDGEPMFPGEDFGSTAGLITGLRDMHAAFRYSRSFDSRLELTLTIEPENPNAFQSIEEKILAANAEPWGFDKVARVITQYTNDDPQSVLDFIEKFGKRYNTDKLEIIPGIMPISNYAGILEPREIAPGVMVDRLNVPVPKQMTEDFRKAAQKGEEALRELALKRTVAQVNAFKAAGINHFHFFNANRRALTQAVMAEAGLIGARRTERIQRPKQIPKPLV